jgi:subtilisin family serine protease
MRLSRIKGSYSVGVASRTDSTTLQSREPVPVNDLEIAALCSSLRAANPGTPIECEANVLFHTAVTPNDTFYSSLYGMTKIAAPSAWDLTTGSASVVIAVIDSGVDYTHPDLVANIHTNTAEVAGNFLDDDSNGFVDDFYGYDFVNSDGAPLDDDEHGTHCAGTVGARGNNATGVTGVNWQVGILPIKVLDANGDGFLSDIAAGIEYSVDRGASILSMSLSGPSSSGLLDSAIDYARQQNVLVVVAAGNDGLNNDETPSFPASSTAANILAVAATNSRDQLASFSNYGEISVDVAAPGVEILSTVPNSLYKMLSGTSMATPHVAGLAGLVKAANGSLTYAQIKDIIMASVDERASLRGTTVSGGRVNAANAVSMGLGLPTPTPTPAFGAHHVSLSIERATRRNYLSGTVTDSGGGPIVGVQVHLFCNRRRVASKLTDDVGYYEFARRRPAAPVRCSVRDATNVRSPIRTAR